MFDTGHKIYKISGTELIPLSPTMGLHDNSDLAAMAEKRYRKILLGMELTKNVFFSYTYYLAFTLQRNHTMYKHDNRQEVFESMFVWNCYLTRSVTMNVP